MNQSTMLRSIMNQFIIISPFTMSLVTTISQVSFHCAIETIRKSSFCRWWTINLICFKFCCSWSSFNRLSTWASAPSANKPSRARSSWTFASWLRTCRNETQSWIWLWTYRLLRIQLICAKIDYIWPIKQKINIDSMLSIFKLVDLLFVFINFFSIMWILLPSIQRPKIFKGKSERRTSCLLLVYDALDRIE